MSERITHAPETQITRISAEKEVQHLTDISNNIQERIKRDISFDLEEPIENLITISPKENEEDGTIRYTLEISPVLLSVLHKQGAINCITEEIKALNIEVNKDILHKGHIFQSVADTKSNITALEKQYKDPQTTEAEQKKIQRDISIHTKILNKYEKREQNKSHIETLKAKLQNIVKRDIDFLDLDPKLDALATRYQQETVETLQTIVQNMVLKVWIKEKKSTSPESQTSEITDKNNSIKPAILAICGSFAALAITVIILPKTPSKTQEDNDNQSPITNHTHSAPLYTFTQPYHLYEQEPELSWEELSVDFFRQKITNHIEAEQLAIEFVETHYPSLDESKKKSLQNQMAEMLYARNIDFSDIANCQIAREMTILCGYNVTQYLTSIRPQGNPNILVSPHHIDQKTKEAVVTIILNAIKELPMSINERNILAEQWLPIVWTEAFNDAKMWAPRTPSIRFSQNDEGKTNTHYKW